MESQVHGNRNESWTNEKHVRFLNSVEARFVRTMIENNGRNLNLRLDRQLPDSSESTLDCKQNHATKKHAAWDLMGTTSSKKKVRPDKRSRRPVPYQPLDSSQDQVVPQIENRTRDKDEKDVPNLPVAVSMAPAK